MWLWSLYQGGSGPSQSSPRPPLTLPLREASVVMFLQRTLVKFKQAFPAG